MALKGCHFCAECLPETNLAVEGECPVFNRRRRAAGTTASDQPFCAMCGQAIRVDASTGRCALGHRVAPAVVAAAAATAAVPAAGDLTAPVEPLGGYVDERIAAFTAERTYDPYAELAATEAPAWDTADDSYADLATAETPAWDTADEPTQALDSIEDFTSWDDDTETGASALDYDYDYDV